MIFVFVFCKLSWFKNDEPLAASNRFTPNYDLRTNIATLKVDEAHLSDIGKYRVLAENVAGKDQTEAETFVLNTANIDEKPNIDPEKFINLERVPDSTPYDKPEDADKGKPPKFIIHLPIEYKIQIGKKLHLKCKVEGYPYPKVRYNFPYKSYIRNSLVY